MKERKNIKGLTPALLKMIFVTKPMMLMTHCCINECYYFWGKVSFRIEDSDLFWSTTKYLNLGNLRIRSGWNRNRKKEIKILQTEKPLILLTHCSALSEDRVSCYPNLNKICSNPISKKSIRWKNCKTIVMTLLLSSLEKDLA